MTVTIRAGRAEDAAAIATLHHDAVVAAYSSIFPPDPPPPTPAELTPDYDTFLAEARVMYEQRGWVLVPGRKLVSGDLDPPIEDVLYDSTWRPADIPAARLSGSRGCAARRRGRGARARCVARAGW